MVNKCESLINVVNPNKPKMLIGLDQKVCGQVQALTHSSAAVVEPPAVRRDLTRVGLQAERGKPVTSPGNREGKP